LCLSVALSPAKTPLAAKMNNNNNAPYIAVIHDSIFQCH
jgi:hypothetical protein